MHRYILLLSALCLAALVAGLSAPPPGAITVGAGGDYPTLSAALEDESSNTYFVFGGTYTGQALISRPNIKMFGQTNVSDSYVGNTVTFTNDLPASQAGSNDASGTIRVHAVNVSLYNLNIANTFGKPVDQAQAIALSIAEGQFAGYGLKVTGDQDTLLANVGAQFYANSWIEGAVDFIFGMEASIWITNSTINSIGSGCITASGRSSNDSFWYVIDNSVVTASSPSPTVFLGRPWRDWARVVFQNTQLPANVPPAGWSVWEMGDPQTDHVTFAEFNNSGPGARGPRANFSTTLDAPVSILTVLNSTDWIDPAFL